MLAHALLAVIAAHEHADRPAPAGLVALTCNEIRRPFTISVIEPGRTWPARVLVALGDDVTNTAPAPAAWATRDPRPVLGASAKATAEVGSAVGTRVDMRIRVRHDRFEAE